MTFHFADDVIAALGNPTKGIHSAKSLRHNSKLSQHSTGLKRMMRSSGRFVLDDDFTAFALEASMRASASDLLSQYELFRLPHEFVWIEWNEIARQQAMLKVGNDIDLQVQQPNWDTIANHVGYLLHNDESITPHKQESIIANPFIGFDEEYKNTTTASPLSIQFAVLSETSGFTLEDHRKFREDYTGTKATDHEAKKARTDEILATIDGLGEWWIKKEGEHDKPSLEKLLNHIRLIQGAGVVFYPQYHKTWTEDGMRNLSKAGMDMTRGDSRFLITVMALLNYDWVIKTPHEPARKQRYKYGKFNKGHSHIEVALDLPKWQGVTITPKGFGEMNESSRRQHSVRGHWRRYKTGERVWINSHLRGDPKLGTITKDFRLQHRSDR